MASIRWTHIEEKSLSGRVCLTQTCTHSRSRSNSHTHSHPFSLTHTLSLSHSYPLTHSPVPPPTHSHPHFHPLSRSLSHSLSISLSLVQMYALESERKMFIPTFIPRAINTHRKWEVQLHRLPFLHIRILKQANGAAQWRNLHMEYQWNLNI